MTTECDLFLLLHRKLTSDHLVQQVANCDSQQVDKKEILLVYFNLNNLVIDGVFGKIMEVCPEVEIFEYSSSIVARCRLSTYVRRAFSIAVPTVWSSLYQTNS